MAAAKTLNIRIDPDLKEQAEHVLSDIGLPTSTAITIFLKAVVRCGGIPFMLKASTPNAETRAAIEDVENGRNLVGPFDTVKDFMNYLEEDDDDA